MLQHFSGSQVQVQRPDGVRWLCFCRPGSPQRTQRFVIQPFHYTVQLSNIFWILHGAGVKKFEINLEEQAVFVVAEHCLSFETVLGAIKAKGKNVRSGEADGAAQTV